MSKDGMSKDDRKMSPMHVTLKAGVRKKYISEISIRINIHITEKTLIVPSCLGADFKRYDFFTPAGSENYLDI